MYINPFVAGVLATILAEFVFMVVFALITIAKDKSDGDEENN